VAAPDPGHGYRYAVGREKTREFALAIGEHDPLYLDLDAARAAGYRDLLAPPMFVAVYAGPAFRALLFAPALEIDRQMTVHGAQEFCWGVPVVAGDELVTNTQLRSDELRGARRFLVIETTSTNQDAQLVAVGSWTVIVRPRSGAAQR
jgi:acyl dehydratase